MAICALIGVDLLAALCISRLRRGRHVTKAHAGDAHPLRRIDPNEAHVSDDGFHFATVFGKSLPIHAASHATIYPASKCQHLVVDHHWEGRESRDKRRGIGFEAGLQVTIRAGEIVTGIAQGRIRRVAANVGRRIGNELPSITNEFVLGRGRQRRRVP